MVSCDRSKSSGHASGTGCFFYTHRSEKDRAGSGSHPTIETSYTVHGIIWTRGHAVPPLTIDEHGLRLTVMRGDLIFAEFDLLENRWISGDYSHKSKSWQNSLSLFRQKFGFELSDPQPSNPEDIFLIGDLHLGHANIINYCSRPFLASDVREMDHVLIKNWNYTISPANSAYIIWEIYGTAGMRYLHPSTGKNSKAGSPLSEEIMMKPNQIPFLRLPWNTGAFVFCWFMILLMQKKSSMAGSSMVITTTMICVIIHSLTLSTVGLT